MINQAVCCNTSGTIKEAGATEAAMLKMIEKFGINYLDYRKQFLSQDFIRFHFTSKRKRMSTILENIKDAEFSYDKRLHIKGAAEIVLNTCSHFLNEDGEKVELHDEMKQNLLHVIEKYAKCALRTICFAYKDLKQNEGGHTHEEMAEDNVQHVVEQSDTTCVCIFGIKDIIRPEVPEAVKTCQGAGVKVRMVTGDNKITAMAIAKECGIIQADIDLPNDCVLEGPEFYERMGGLICKNCNTAPPCSCDVKDKKEEVKNFAAFKSIRNNLCVLARSRPEDKYLLVTGLRQHLDVVAVTGDGTNDAPALKKADVGFAMGITGTDVAKHAADIIVMDDNFASIVKACMWGRNIYDNIRRFLQFQLTVNIVALISAFIGACILKESPLQPIQLLWVNLIMDSLASLALATEPPKPALLERPPYRRDEYIISRKMVKHLLGMAVFQSIIVFVIVFAGERFIPEEEAVSDENDMCYPLYQDDYIHNGRPYDWDGSAEIYKKYEDDCGSSRHMAVVFNVFVWMQIFNMLNARKINDEKNIFKGITENNMFLIVWFIIFIGQVLIAQFGSKVFKVNDHGLTIMQWVISVGIGLTTLLVDFIIKFFPDEMCP